MKKYFKVTTKRITLLGMLLALNIICEVISQYVLGSARIGGFLSFSITFWTVLVTYLATNLFYTFIFLEITEFFRMAFGQDIISTISLNLSDLTFLLIFVALVFVMKVIVKLFKEPKSEKWSYFIIMLVAMVIATLGTSGMDVVYNKYFMFSWYYRSAGTNLSPTKGILIMIFWFNIVEYAINCTIYSLVYNPAYILVNRYNQ